MRAGILNAIEKGLKRPAALLKRSGFLADCIGPDLVSDITCRIPPERLSW